uniref:Polysaccharide export-related periplasmic protein n=1 Tax=uncultured Prochlorococcus marinus clone HF10-11H11 TaxID=379375 RepID=Q1PK98_PROMR|nr:polysaccharide export-related periplasmic protein [uncultured Prochlorococcus marinus clone HF10-11H11]
MILLKVSKNIFIEFFSLKRKFKPFLIFNVFLLLFIFDLSKADTNFPNKKNNQIEIEYLESRNELEDYIIDTGDQISLVFFPAEELSGVFSVNEEGELLLPRIDETFVRGLTKSELKTLLEKRYAEFLIDPEIKVRIAGFKSIRVLARGELRNPGFYKFPAYSSVSYTKNEKLYNTALDSLMENKNEKFEIGQNSQFNNQSLENVIVKRSSENITTISDVIKKAGGITSKTDLSKIEIIRDIPLGKGGGKKRAIIDFNAYVYESDPTNDMRIFDGDTLFFPKLSKNNPNQIPKSILSGISPKFISVNLFGRVETPGVVKLPLEAALSDAIDISGPIKPLSGKIVLIRYEQDGKVIKKNISYSASAKRGSRRNPYLKEDDLISVKNSILGKTTDVLREVTAPFVGIYSTKELIEGFSD